jgi:hypothetical protein
VWLPHRSRGADAGMANFVEIGFKEDSVESISRMAAVKLQPPPTVIMSEQVWALGRILTDLISERDGSTRLRNQAWAPGTCAWSSVVSRRTDGPLISWPGVA